MINTTLSDYLEYDETSPTYVRWRVPRTHSMKPGHQAGCVSTTTGYIVIRIFDKLMQGHRVVWELVNGGIPDGMEIDHVDGDRTNNRITNLRLATSSNNKWNRGKGKNNTSGYKGVCWDNQHKAWRSQICINYKRKLLGIFDSKEEAYAAYCKAAADFHLEFRKV